MSKYRVLLAFWSNSWALKLGFTGYFLSVKREYEMKLCNSSHFDDTISWEISQNIQIELFGINFIPQITPIESIKNDCDQILIFSQWPNDNAEPQKCNIISKANQTENIVSSAFRTHYHSIFLHIASKSIAKCQHVICWQRPFHFHRQK